MSTTWPFSQVVNHVNIDVPLATLQAATSGVAFSIGSALPTNANLLDYSIRLLQVCAGGTVASATVSLAATGETAAALHAALNVFTGATVQTYKTVGSNPHPIRGGQQIQMVLTLGGDTPNHLTTGHVSVDLFFAMMP